MRVLKPTRRRQRSLKPHKAKQSLGTQGLSFSHVLQAEQIEPIDLLFALQEIDEYARRLKENPVYENLLRYRGKVREVLKYLVQQCYVVSENSFYDPTGRRRILMIVENVDEKLEALTKDFLRNQHSSLELVGRLDEIRGLLFDLYT